MSVSRRHLILCLILPGWGEIFHSWGAGELDLGLDRGGLGDGEGGERGWRASM